MSAKHSNDAVDSLSDNSEQSCAQKTAGAGQESTLLILTSVLCNVIILVLLIHIIWPWTTETPHADQWDYEGKTLVLYFHHALSLSYLFSQHNESHLFIPRIVALLYAPLTGWNIQVEIVLTLGCALLSSIGLSCLFVTNPLLTSVEKIIGILAATALCLCCMQWEVLLFGAYYFVIPGLCLIWALVIAANTISYTYKVILWSLLSLLATLSYVNGVLLWVLIGLVVVLEGRNVVKERERRLSMGGFFVIGTLTLILYFSTYHRPLKHPSLDNTMNEPSRMVLYYLSWLGAPFARVEPTTLISRAVGIVLLTAFVGSLAWLYLRKRQVLVSSHCYCWIVLGLYVLLTGVTITIGRSGFGVDQAFASRYQSFSILLPAVCFPLFCVLIRDLAFGSRQALRLSLSCCSGVLALLFCLSYRASSIELRSYGQMRKTTGLAVEFATVFPNNPWLQISHPDPARLVAVCRSLAPFHLPAATSRAAEIIRRARLVHQKTVSLNGYLDQAADLGNGTIAVAGWALNQNAHEPASFVLIEWQGTNGSTKPIDFISVDAPRPDVAKALNNPILLPSGFGGVIAKSSIPGPGVLSAWAVDNQTQDVEQLGNLKAVSN